MSFSANFRALTYKNLDLRPESLHFLRLMEIKDDLPFQNFSLPLQPESESLVRAFNELKINIK